MLLVGNLPKPALDSKDRLLAGLTNGSHPCLTTVKSLEVDHLYLFYAMVRSPGFTVISDIVIHLGPVVLH